MIRINIESNDNEKLPSTTTSKNGLRQDDERLESVYEWIRSKLPEPKRKASSIDHEIELFKLLEEKKLKILKDYDKSLIVKREMNSFTTFNEKIRIDLYVSCIGKTTIYEGKKDITSPLDVYQLMMYWDGLVMDNIKVDEGILISAKHPESVKALVENKNQSKDSKGNQYNFVLKTWKEEDIDYPN